MNQWTGDFAQVQTSARTTADDSLSLGCAIYGIFCDNTVTVFVMCDGFLLNVSQNHHN